MRTASLVLLSALGLAAACGTPRQPTPEGSGLQAFESEAALRDALREAREARAAFAAAESAPSCDVGGGSLVSRTAGARADGSVVFAGHVTEPSGLPLAGTMLTLVGTAAGTLASLDGTYRLEVEPAAVADTAATVDTVDTVVRGIRAEMVGYEAASLDVELAAGDSVVVDFTLCEARIQLHATMVATPVIAEAAITNVQHEGVDEGGIVKLRGDHLVILRRGRLFTVDVGDGRLTPVSAVDAYAPGIDGARTWYDELLVSGDDVVVVGYSYARGGTEIGLFRIDDDGRLHYRDTYHLRSNDYYSSRNYSSRLIGDRLLFYAPIRPALSSDSVVGSLPAMRRWRADATEDDFRPIIEASRVYRPGRGLEAIGYPVLHTVTACDLAAPELACEATAVLGPHGRVFYVSPDAVYVWVSDWGRRYGDDPVPGMLYRMPLDGSAPTALGVAGTPVDQFSFLESDDDHLNVLVRSDAYGDWMWGPEHAAGATSLLRVSLDAFGDGTRAAARSDYRPLPNVEGDAFHNRFVGDHLLFGSGAGWGRPKETGRSVLYAVRWADAALAELSLSHGVDRIEPMGDDAVVIGSDGQDLHFTGIDLGALPAVAQRWVRPDATQGELRSHGFFYRADGPATGTIGLPIRGAGRPGYAHLRHGSASIVFLRNQDASFRELGELAAAAGDADVRDDGCVASCVDWYGNARPLFTRGRVFALLGYEIVEGTVRDGRLREARRVDFAPSPRGAAEHR